MDIAENVLRIHSSFRLFFFPPFCSYSTQLTLFLFPIFVQLLIFFLDIFHLIVVIRIVPPLFKLNFCLVFCPSICSCAFWLFFFSYFKWIFICFLCKHKIIVFSVFKLCSFSVEATKRPTVPKPERSSNQSKTEVSQESGSPKVKNSILCWMQWPIL